MRDTIDNRLNEELNQYSQEEKQEIINSHNKQQISCQNLFTGLHSSVLSRDSGKPESILTSLIDQFDGPELSQQAVLSTN